MLEFLEKFESIKRKISFDIDILTLSCVGVISTLYVSNFIENSHIRVILLACVGLNLFLNGIKFFSTLIDLEKLVKAVPEPSKDEIMRKVESTLGISKEGYTQRNGLDYLKCFPKEHPYYVFSVTGLYLSSLYFPYAFDNIKMLLDQIPLVGNIYASFYSPFNIVLLFLISEYTKHIVNAVIRLAVKIHVFILSPIILVSFLSGIIVYFILPFRFGIYLLENNLNLSQLYNDIVLWFSDPINVLNVSMILVIIMFSFRTLLFKSIRDNINKLEFDASIYKI